MPFVPDLSKRAQTAELMDSLESDKQQLFNTLELFPMINRWLTPCHRLMKRHILSEMKRSPDRSWSMLDIGAGGGDLLRWLTKQCQASGIDFHATCLDHDPRVIEFANTQCHDFDSIEVRQADARKLAETEERWDFVFANHFLHHLNDEDIVPMLRVVHAITKTRFVMSDIHRSLLNYVGYSSLLPLRVTNSFVWYDGRLSIRKGFTLAECKALIKTAGIESTTTAGLAMPGHLVIIGNRCV